MKRLLVCLILSLSSAQAGFLDRKAEGWHWYELFKQPDVSKLDETPDETLSPAQQLQAFKQEVEDRKAIAVMAPTAQNVKAYMEVQKELMDKAHRFQSKWMEVVYTTPALDYSIEHPTSQVGRHVYLDEKKRTTDQTVRNLAKTHGLFFFYSGSCAYCKHFAPIVKSFADAYGWEVMAISTDGSLLPEFPHAVQDNGVASRLGVEVVPSLIAVNPGSEESFPLSHGLSTQDQILDRIRVLILERRGQ